MGSNSSLEIVFEGKESDVDLIIIASEWTLLRFISKTTGDCIIVPFLQWTKWQKNNMKKGLRYSWKVNCGRQTDHRTSSSCCKRFLYLCNRHYPCSHWFNGGGKCTVACKPGGGGGVHPFKELLGFRHRGDLLCHCTIYSITVAPQLRQMEGQQ